MVSAHVDDFNKEGGGVSKEFWDHLESKWSGIKLQTGPRCKHLSWDTIQDPVSGPILRSQSYIRDMLTSLKVNKFEYHPMRAKLLTAKTQNP